MSSITMNSGTTAVDGRVGREGASESWATLIAGAGNVVDYAGTGVVMRLSATATLNLWAALRRGVFLFDPAPLPAGAIIQGGSLSLYSNTTPSNNFLSNLVLTNAPVTAYTSLITADYALLHAQMVEHGTARVAVSSLIAATRFSFTLNAQALVTFQSLYDSGNVFELGLLFDWDFLSTTPVWVSGATDDITIISQNHATSANWPILTITYRVGKGHATVTLKGTLGNSGDTVTADMWAVEVFT